MNYEVIQTNEKLRAEARLQLRGVWSQMIVVEYIYVLITSLLSNIASRIEGKYSGGGNVLWLVALALECLLYGPLLFGMACYYLKKVRGMEVAVKNIFCGFRRFIPSFLLFLLTNLFTILWSLLLIIPGIVKWLGYSMAFFIMNDDPKISPVQALRKSQIMMKGYKWKLLELKFEFVGWFILAGLPVLVIFLSIFAMSEGGYASLVSYASGTKNVLNFMEWLIIDVLSLPFVFMFALYPYMNLANANFYENLKKNQAKTLDNNTDMEIDQNHGDNVSINDLTVNFEHNGNQSKFMPQAILIAVITVIFSTTIVFAQTPDIKWYTKKPNAKSYNISTADELAGLAILSMSVVDSGIVVWEDDIPTYNGYTTLNVDLPDSRKYRNLANEVSVGRMIVKLGDDPVIYAPVSFYGKTIKLVKDIDLSKYCHGSKFNGGNGWVPFDFNGIFDGNGKTVRGLRSSRTINGDYEGRVWTVPGGIFDCIAGTVKNLGIVGANVTGGGGIVGTLFESGSVSNCYFTGTVDGIGGIVGWLQGGKVSNCYFVGTVSSGGTAGGIVGEAGGMFVTSGGKISNCYSVGTVSGTAGVGGIVGNLDKGGSVSNCYSIATIIGESSVGGIVGWISNLKKTN